MEDCRLSGDELGRDGSRVCQRRLRVEPHGPLKRLSCSPQRLQAAACTSTRPSPQFRAKVAATLLRSLTTYHRPPQPDESPQTLSTNYVWGWPTPPSFARTHEKSTSATPSSLQPPQHPPQCCPDPSLLHNAPAPPLPADRPHPLRRSSLHLHRPHNLDPDPRNSHFLANSVLLNLLHKDHHPRHIVQLGADRRHRHPIDVYTTQAPGQNAAPAWMRYRSQTIGRSRRVTASGYTGYTFGRRRSWRRSLHMR
ncbi:hypothetical protein BDK51DRAFT_47935 [Blyttiomyces helicus]|uniref:Uncharacterized protein n=1 Tax=Blyttiomyces helicus TaxID=388810 RepID=A0A4P9W0A8_9FUNG|nr:hypothetical protein BDK51DRAFT_47935 [Blyttiomyces helicus]|eukprot:RKO85504.1 hypothetical protein BDK51DRAFT_47935 [Blyttiomyces helicus]